eukprot:1158697-Pelagomonas_calceolata.AAC.10
MDGKAYTHGQVRSNWESCDVRWLYVDERKSLHARAGADKLGAMQHALALCGWMERLAQAGASKGPGSECYKPEGCTTFVSSPRNTKECPWQ